MYHRKRKRIKKIMILSNLEKSNYTLFIYLNQT